VSEMFTYAAALSFAGEDRDLARYIARELRSEFSIFLDEFERAQLWGADLSEMLPQKYQSSRYCVILQSNEYLEKIWTTLERQAIIYEFLSRRGKDYVLPLLVRNCQKKIPGLSGLIGYLTIRSEDDWPDVVQLLRTKLMEGGA
jgi:hypothetical protein